MRLDAHVAEHRRTGASQVVAVPAGCAVVLHDDLGGAVPIAERRTAIAFVVTDKHEGIRIVMFRPPRAQRRDRLL